MVKNLFFFIFFLNVHGQIDKLRMRRNETKVWFVFKLKRERPGLFVYVLLWGELRPRTRYINIHYYRVILYNNNGIRIGQHVILSGFHLSLHLVFNQIR
jgi:hypothetical protein